MVRVASNGVRAACLGLAVAVAGLAAQAQVRVGAVQVDGNQRIPDSTIVSLLGIQPGASATDGQINDGLQRIMGSGLFETADVQTTGSGLVVTVVERPTINRISIEGNERITDEALLPVVTSTPRRVYSPQAAATDAAAIADAYNAAARLSATVTPKIIRRSDNRVDLIFEIGEGRPVENERISFVGNRDFSDRRLRRVIDTKQAGFLRTIIGRDTYVPERIDFDRQLLTDFYRSRGYVDFQVLNVASELSRERDATFITFNVREGQSFDVGQVSVSSEYANLNVEAYRRALRIRPGQTWSPSLIDENIARLERKALQDGFDFLRVDPRVTRNDRDLSLNVEFALVRGPRVFVERIDIEGNRTTLDRVIRRQFDTVEGDPFNPREIRNAAERIRALGFFSNADVETREGSSADQVVVDVNVEEQATGSLSFGGSFNDESGFALLIGFSERNFLGRGQSLSFNLESGTENSRSTFSFAEPAFLGRDLTFGLRLAYITSDYDNATYDTTVASISPSLSFPVSENGRLTLRYEAAREEIVDVSTDASPIIQAEEGDLFRSSLGYDYTLDLLRGGLNPNRGVRVSFGQEFAGLGGDVEYVKSSVRGVAQRDFLNEEVTLRAIFEGGTISSIGDGGTRVTDRYFLNSRQLRGFASREVGPRDTGAAEPEVLGGNNFASLRFEADFPLGLPEEYGLSGGVFADFASLWGLDDTAGVATVDDSFELRSAVGFSLYWTTPIGPLKMNFAKPIQKNDLDVEKSFDLTISTQF
ncbi:outer membrane protein assembly factor BamA [Silicimonas algicola]|uniref:Outer membrane protein assembly factor BamA n=1 Tax=Silicimonas algicola TaxID=1826607 RepID=A0A316GQI8_9RHOB|nr:outer membrane protein assembly factor BamA [Silicimonas algicola]AZQ67539.1 outer membrane protein assembly factor BamA [Silicimonas algicola]PWK57237.1 Beta-barrel assembly machine subunit BamA [Silicimonas algicola]